MSYNRSKKKYSEVKNCEDGGISIIMGIFLCSSLISSIRFIGTSCEHSLGSMELLSFLGSLILGSVKPKNIFPILPTKKTVRQIEIRLSDTYP